MTDAFNQSKNKSIKLILSLLFDGIGILSYVVPVFGESIDVIWAPVSGFLLVFMYKGAVGRTAGVIGFLEELLPMTDFIPTFTLTWLYTYVIDSKKE